MEVKASSVRRGLQKCVLSSLQATETGARTRLLLLDEVDAALDESNQARVAALLHRMCAPGAAQRCQVLFIWSFLFWHVETYTMGSGACACGVPGDPSASGVALLLRDLICILARDVGL